MKKLHLNACLVFVALLGLTACVKKTDTQVPTPKTYVNVMNMAYNSPPVEIYLNDKKATQNLPPGDYSTVYSPIEAINYEIEFKKSGSDSLVASLPSVKYDSLSYYTVLLYGDGAVSKAFRIEDDFKNISLSKANWRFFHMSPNTGAVDVYVDSEQIALSRQYADNVGFGGLNNFQFYNSGIYTIRVKLAGTDTQIAQMANIVLAQGASYTIILKGLEGTTGSTQIELELLQAMQ